MFKATINEYFLIVSSYRSVQLNKHDFVRSHVSVLIMSKNSTDKDRSNTHYRRLPSLRVTSENATSNIISSTCGMNISGPIVDDTLTADSITSVNHGLY
jgi:hypothetical protein